MTNPNESTTPRIDRHDASQVERCRREFGVTDDQLAEAMAKVGDKAADEELYLKGSRSSTIADTADAAEKAK